MGPYHGNFRRWRRTYQQRRCEAKITTVRALGIAWLGTWRRELREDERQTGLRLSGCKNNFFFRLRLRRLYNFLFPITFDCVRIRLWIRNLPTYIPLSGGREHTISGILACMEWDAYLFCA